MKPLDTQLDAIKNLLAIRSTADNIDALNKTIDLVTARLKTVPEITVEHFVSDGKPSILAYTGAKRPKRFKVLLNGHLDVVPGKPEQFEPYEKDGNLYGRGALDMKAATLVLAEVFCELAPKLSFPLGLQIVTDEEIGGHHGTLHQVEQGVAADLVIAGEFTPETAICTESRGICTARVTFAGTAAHGAYVWDGDNAAIKATTFVQKLLTHYPIPTKEIWGTTVNVAGISTPSTTFNRVPDLARVQLDCRYIPGDPNFTSQETVEAFLHTIDPACTVAFNLFEPAHHADATNPLVKKLAAALASTTGKPTIFIKKPGGADVRFYSDRSMQAVVLGLQGKGLHGDDEYLEIASLGRYKQTLSAFLGALKSH